MVRKELIDRVQWQKLDAREFSHPFGRDPFMQSRLGGCIAWVSIAEGIS
jgi:hypothetical protein